MFTIEETREVCRKAFKQEGLDFDYENITLSFNGRLKKTLGRCGYSTIDNDIFIPKYIELSKQLAEKGTKEEIVQVILHECAHAITTIKDGGQKHGHDKVFKMTCKRIGCNLDGTSGHTSLEDDLNSYKYIVTCKKCGQVVAKYHRAGKVLKNIEYYTHNDCGGHLEFVQNF
jgi:predicted SprT family Zn-dependent metalloprotease